MKTMAMAVLWMGTALAGSALAGNGARPWYADRIVGMEVGPTGAQFGSDPSDTGYAAGFSGREIVEAQIETGSEYIVIWGKDSEYAYYNSDAAPRCPGLKGRDVIAETVEAARPHGLPVIVYCVVQGNGYPLRRHPGFQMRGSDGAELGRICFNSGYIHHATAVLDEMLAYDIQGLHIDMLDQGFGPPLGCWCESCRKLFEGEHGRPMPKGVTWDADWDRVMAFRYKTSERFEKRLYQFAKSRKPGVSVDFNYHGYPPFSWEAGQRPVQHAVNGDFVTGESGVWGFSALGGGLTARFLAAAAPEQPFQVVMQRGVRMYHDMTTRPLNDMRWEMLTLLSHGAQVTLVDKTPYDGSLDKEAYRRFGELFREARAKREAFGHPVEAGAGVYYSSRTRDWHGREDASRYQQAFHGVHAALAFHHIPYEIVLDENLDLGRLRSLPVLIVPNAAILSERETAVFREYVEDGGNLILTGPTGARDWMGNPMDRSALADIVGAEWGETLPSIDNHMRFAKLEGAEAELSRDIAADWPFLVKGPAVVWKPAGAKALGELMKPHRTVRQTQGLEGTEWPMSADAPVGPAVLVNEVGKGRVLTFAGSPGFASASEHAMAEDRLLIRNAVRFLNPNPAVRIEAPAHVEAVVTHDRAAKRYIVHLLGYLSPPGWTPSNNRPFRLPVLIQDKPVYEAAIELRRGIAAVRCLNADTELRMEGRRVRLLVRDIHEAVSLEYE